MVAKSKGKAKKPTGSRLSGLNLVSAALKVQEKINKTWSIAPKAKMFTKRPDPKKKYYRINKKTGKKEEYTVVRRNRLIGTHAYKMAASGAALHAAAVYNAHGAAYLTPTKGEELRAPALLSIGDGALLMLEQFLCAYAQEATAHAREIRIGLNTVVSKDGSSQCTQKRLNRGAMRLGFDAADANIFGASMPTARTVVCKLQSKSKGKAGDEAGETKA